MKRVRRSEGRPWLGMFVGIAVAVLLVTSISAAGLGRSGRGRGNNETGTVFVKSQGLYYDTFVPVDALPHEGPFQDIYMNEEGIGVTEFGPGDQGYVGGRWQVVDPVTHEPVGVYLLCPLLGPGRTSP